MTIDKARPLVEIETYAVGLVVNWRRREYTRQMLRACFKRVHYFPRRQQGFVLLTGHFTVRELTN